MSWLSWTLFWLGFHYLGVVQTWVFGDHTNKPALFDLVGPLHFWFPWVVFMLPLILAERPLSALWPSHPGWISHVAAAFWVLALSRLIVLSQDQLHPRRGGWVTVVTIAGSTTILVLLRLTARGSSAAPYSAGVDVASGLFLLGLVLATWIYVLVGLIVGMVRWGKRRNPSDAAPS